MSRFWCLSLNFHWISRSESCDTRDGQALTQNDTITHCLCLCLWLLDWLRVAPLTADLIQHLLFCHRLIQSRENSAQHKTLQLSITLRTLNFTKQLSKRHCVCVFFFSPSLPLSRQTRLSGCDMTHRCDSGTRWRQDRGRSVILGLSSLGTRRCVSGQTCQRGRLTHS